MLKIVREVLRWVLLAAAIIAAAFTQGGVKIILLVSAGVILLDIAYDYIAIHKLFNETIDAICPEQEEEPEVRTLELRAPDGTLIASYRGYDIRLGRDDETGVIMVYVDGKTYLHYVVDCDIEPDP